MPAKQIRELPDNYRPALADDVPEGRACGNCYFYDESRVNEAGDKAWCERWDDYVDGGAYCNSWQEDDEEDRAKPDELAVGDFVSWDNSGGMARGRIVRIVRDGDINIPDSTFTITGTPEDPAALIVLYREFEDGYQATATRVGHKFSTLTKIANLDRDAIQDEEGSAMTDPMDEGRAKWLKVAYAIKAKLEGADEARSIGKTEIRTNQIELRAEGDGMTFTGYAALFNQPSLPLPFTEYVRPGAFKRSLQSRNRMMLLWNHDTSNPLASTRNGSLKLEEDAIGLKVTATLPQTTLGFDIATLIRTSVIDAMSFGFSVRKDSWSQDGQVRYLDDVTLFEVSVVSTPAYEQTSGTISVRSGISADALADALLKIESGEELEPEQGALVNDVIGKLTKTPEVEEVEGDILALKQKKLALLMMGI